MFYYSPMLIKVLLSAKNIIIRGKSFIEKCLTTHNILLLVAIIGNVTSAA